MGEHCDDSEVFVTCTPVCILHLRARMMSDRNRLRWDPVAAQSAAICTLGSVYRNARICLSSFRDHAYLAWVMLCPLALPGPSWHQNKKGLGSNGLFEMYDDILYGRQGRSNQSNCVSHTNKIIGVIYVIRTISTIS